MTTLILFLVISVIAAAAAIIVLKNRTLAIAALVLINLLSLVYKSAIVVQAGHVGVQVTLGTVNLEPLSEGFHLVNPISEVRDLEVRLVAGNISNAQAGTKDLQQVHTDITVNYRLSASKAAHIYKDFGVNVADKVLVPAVNEAVKSVTAKYTSEELITKRDEVSAHVLQHIKDKISQYDININSVAMSNFQFSPEYQKSIEQKVIATQNKLKAEQDLSRIQVEAQQAIAKAEGEAKSIQIQTAAINSQGGLAYVELKKIEKWDGKLPQFTGGQIPFINLNK